MKQFIKTFEKVCFVILSILGVISWIFPFCEVNSNNIMWRSMVLIIFIIILIAISFIVLNIQKKRNSIEIYKKGKTKIVFQYDKLDKLLNECLRKKSTIVVPINTFMPYVGDKEKLRNTSVHYQVLAFLQDHGIKLDKSSVEGIKRKKINMCDNENCTIGNWFVLSLKDNDIESDLKFLFLVNGRLREDNGRMNNEEPTKADYLVSLQSLCDAIKEQTDMEEDVYVPLLGAGNTNVGDSSEIMKVLKDILLFNKSNLSRHITVFIDPKYKNEAQIIELQR